VSKGQIAGRLLGLDYGTVRIGLAITDPDRILASPLATYTRKSVEEDAAQIVKIVADNHVVALVVGLPIHSDGRESDKSREAREFGAWLTCVTKLPVIFWDERFSTARAEDALIGAKLNPRARKKRRDRVAAQMILQAYLDAGCPPNGTEVPPQRSDSELDEESGR
jgi:putative holliday junction resolvase